jgi:hypothetical protein
MRGKRFVTGALSGVAMLILSAALAQAHDDVTIRVAPPTYDVQRYYVARPPVVVTPSPPPVVVMPQVQERVIVQEPYRGLAYSSPPPVYSIPPGSGVFVGPSGVYIYQQGHTD